MSTNLNLSYKITADVAAALKSVSELRALLAATFKLKPTEVSFSGTAELTAAKKVASEKTALADKTAKASIASAKAAATQVVQIETEAARKIADIKNAIAATAAKKTVAVPGASSDLDGLMAPRRNPYVGANLVDTARAKLAKSAGADAFSLNYDKSNASSDAAAAAEIRLAAAKRATADAALKQATALDVSTKAKASAKNKADELKDKVNGTQRSFDGLRDTLKNFAGLVAGGALFSGIVDQLKKVTEATTDYQKTMARLNAGNGGDVKKSAEDYEFLLQVAQKTGLKMGDVSDGFSKFKIAAAEAGVPADEIRQSFLGISEASKVMGLTSYETSLVMLAFTQVASKQKISLEELNQMSEKFPVAMSLAAKAAGLTVPKFMEAVTKGTIDIKTFFPAFGYQLRTFAEKELPNATSSMESEMNRFSNQIKAMRTEAGTGELGDAMAEGIKAFTNALADPAINEFFQSIGKGFAVLLKFASESLPSMALSFNVWTQGLVKDFVIFTINAGTEFDTFVAKVKRGLGELSLTSWMFEDAKGMAEAADKQIKLAEKSRDMQTSAVRDAYKEKVAAMVKASLTPRVVKEDQLPGIPKKAPPNATVEAGNKAAAANKAEAAAARLRKAEESYATAKFEAEKKRIEATRSVEEASLDKSLQFRLTQYQDYLAEKSRLEIAAVDDEIAAAQRRRDIAIASESTEKDPAKKLQFKADIEKINADINALEKKQVVIGVRLEMSTEAFQQKIKDLKEDISANIMELQGDTAGAATTRLQIETARLLKDDVVRADPALTAAVKRQSDLKQQQINVAEQERLMESRASKLSQYEERIALAVSTGKKTAVEAEREIRAERIKTADAILAQVEALEKLAAANPGDDKLALGATKARLEYEKLKFTMDATATAINGELAGSAASFVQEIAKGTNVLEAFGATLSNVFGNLATRALKGFEDELFTALQGKDGQGLGGMLSNFINSSAGGGGGGFSWSGLASSAFSFLSGGFADGGFTGSGGKYDPAGVVHKNEFVFTKAEVQKMGVPYFYGIKKAIKHGPRAGYAEGGLVGGGFAGAAANFSPVINNNSSYDPVLSLDAEDLVNALAGKSSFERAVVKVSIDNKRRIGG